MAELRERKALRWTEPELLSNQISARIILDIQLHEISEK